MKEEEFWLKLQDLYVNIWNCPMLNNCESDFPNGFLEDGQYCQIPFVGSYWWNNIDWIDAKINKKGIPNQLFLAYNPRLGKDEYGYPVNTRAYAEKTLNCKDIQNLKLNEDFDKLHYSFQITGTVNDEDSICYGLLQNELWTGQTYQYGIIELIKELFDKWSYVNPQYISLCNLIPCSGKGKKDTPTSKMIKNCRRVNYIGQLINLICPDIIWMLGKITYENFYGWLPLNNIKITDDIIDIEWARVIEYNQKKSVLLQIRHPSPQSHREGLGDTIRTAQDAIKFYKTLLDGWKNHLDDIPSFLIKKINEIA